ncbi:MAG: hypothetical protein LBH61_08030 [Dysgonamonadaceae bacterium]|jgi:hypothetical protein|nr:hypothetical protein [Dysgonamonadaceae bacterium]
MKQLLEQYWQGKTTPEEEQLLQAFFSGESLPEELEIYRPLFLWKDRQKDIRLDRNEILAAPRTGAGNLYSALKVAASVMILVTVAIGFYTHYKQEKFMDKVFSETYTDPKEAVRETGKIVAKVSTLLQLVPDKLLSESTTDSTKTALTNDSIQ